MSRNTWWGKTLRFIGILLMGITALFTIAGGLGTTCVAVNPTGFGEGMAPLAPFQWLYILFVIVTTAIGIMAARAVFLLAKGRPNSYRYAIIALVLGIVIGVIHMLVSRGLRGKSMPVDGVVYTTVLTLIVFLLFRIPKIWQGVDYTGGDPNDPTGTDGCSHHTAGHRHPDVDCAILGWANPHLGWHELGRSVLSHQHNARAGANPGRRSFACSTK